MTRLDTNLFDYTILAIYFVLVIAIGILARRAIATSEDFLLSGRSLGAWITGLAFISANLGAIEILGMAANGAQYGLSTVHLYWIGAVPAMVFLGLVMMPFYYVSRVRSVPEYLLRRFNPATHLWNALTFAVASVLSAGVKPVRHGAHHRGFARLADMGVCRRPCRFCARLHLPGRAVGCHLQRGPAILRHHRRLDPHCGHRPQCHGWLERLSGEGDEPAWKGKPLRNLVRHSSRQLDQSPRRLDRHRDGFGLRTLLRLLDHKLRRSAACAVGEEPVGR
jgi:Sodium:solute symporter family